MVEKRGGDERGKAFYPDYLFEILIVILLTLEAVIVLAFLLPPALGAPVKLGAQYNPRPEWYFLWLYQLVHYFSGPLVSLGTVILPAVAVGFLGAVPFIDRYGKPARRRVVIAGFSLLFGAVLLLTGQSLL